jgi:hypothetical protein
MDEHQSLSHTLWDCKYHIVFIPKGRRKTLYLELRKHLGEVFRKLAAQKEAKVEASNARPRSHDDDDLDPTELFGVAGGRLHQGKELDPLGAGLLSRTHGETRGHSPRVSNHPLAPPKFEARLDQLEQSDRPVGRPKGAPLI